ncbi:MAG: SRPBCC domain-containing protein [Bacteroidota bacterium]|nr:SRPBCC domain-containing protein [Bacteroidota bacterium]
MDNIEVKVKDTVLKPVAEVFNAVIDPEKLSGFFVSRASGPIKAGETTIWYFDDFGVESSVIVKAVKENELITFEWAASGVTARVDIVFKAIDPNSTSVTITEKSFPFDKTGVSKALGQTQGWTDFLCSLKAYLYCGINLRNGRTKK